jgi:hypothetical protein
MLKPLLAATMLAILATGCAPNPEAQRRAELRTQADLDEALAGRTAGKPLRCIPNYRSSQLQIIDDQTFLYRDGKTIYLQKPLSPCHGLANGSMTLVTKIYGVDQFCRGDINETVDLRTGMRGGACVFGDFVPYTKP